MMAAARPTVYRHRPRSTGRPHTGAARKAPRAKTESMLELENLPPISIMTPNLSRGSYIAEAIDSVRTRNCPAVGHITLGASPRLDSSGRRLSSG